MFCGLYDECQGIMGNAEFVLLPSICYEGCSMTVIEAFSLGKPVIATDIGFMHEAISAVGMNTVFPMKDYNVLRHKVIELWNDPDLCSQYGKIARSEYENKYSEPIDIANLTKIYYNCISENS
ncbi:glycosyltransferase [Faecalibacterium prausnitzii]|uniref:glycosyltransferase n=1 Tax=Faecalibacterium prausnitzii TaxID=853 RepID=UPI002432F2E5|nr:glycosyltransferase [Faecalibacterium prausnitzii]